MYSDYVIFLDDMREVFPCAYKICEDVVHCRGDTDFLKTIKERGCPKFIFFDHDLGYNVKTGYQLAQLFGSMIMDEEIQFHPEFGYHIQSANPVGADNIRHYMENLIREYK